MTWNMEQQENIFIMSATFLASYEYLLQTRAIYSIKRQQSWKWLIQLLGGYFGMMRINKIIKNLKATRYISKTIII